MRPETGAFLSNARNLLERGRLMLEVQLYDDAGRAAYMAAFHAAQALIFERRQRMMKTHHGVQSEFHRLAHDDPAIGAELPAFLSAAYRLKTVADYDVGNHIHPSPEEARRALAAAGAFVEAVMRRIEAGGAGSVSPAP